MSPVVESTLDRLEETRQRWWLFSMLCSVIVAVGLSFALLLVFVLADVVMQLANAWLALLFGVWIGTTIAVVAGTVYRLLRHQRTAEAAARRVEQAFPELGSHLINLLQLAHDPVGNGDPFRQAALDEAAARVGRVSFERAAERHTRWQRWRAGLQTPRDLFEFGGALAALLALAYLLSIVFPKWSSSAERLFQPWRFVPQVGVVKILGVTPGNTDVLVGTRLDIGAQIVRLETRHPKAVLYVTPEGGQETAYGMTANAEHDVFTHSLPVVMKPLQYRLQIGDSQSQLYRVGVRDKPTIDEIEVTYEHAAYLNLAQRSVTQRHADLEAPQFTNAVLRIHSPAVLSKGHVQIDDQRVLGDVDRDDPHVLRVGVWMAKPGGYTIHLFNELGQTDDEPRVNSIRIVPDQPPTVQIAKPGAESSVAPGAELPIVVRAGDDHGLGEVRIEWKIAGPSPDDQSPTAAAEAVHTRQAWRDGELRRATTTTLTHNWTLDPAQFQAGQTLLIRAVALDARQFNRRVYGRDESMAPQQTATAWHRVRFISPEERNSEALARLESINARLWAILQNQLRSRVLAAEMSKKTELAELRLVGHGIRQKQVQVHTGATDLVAGINPADGEEFATLKQVLAKLAHGDMLAAVRQSEPLTTIPAPDATAEHLPELTATQDRIIDVLRKLLEMSRRATSDVLAEMKERSATDLPPDVQAKLKNLADKLQEFLRQQKKIIEATENLAKKPVEDFTEEEQQKLKDLAQAEDDWSRFMEEMHSDFSKLPEQDFSNPSLLEELIEVQTELKMAEGALTKKSADIAVPLEQLGAEMAEQMTTNIEKWLPDTPDRERWSQEEPISDAMKEAPMAELPGELEDIVGELMEDEEDLFDEMEDVSSSWADSIDKGAGWDAMDGPISNNSARGVTGNRLPNESEIGGRSGEGRQGKSSGEFVGDTAVGKGGRKTPSRLAPDPFVKGQVKDISKDPVGGATGGGKESGAGGEGLEGPVGNRPQRDLERLAQKQAELRNKAEGVDVKFKVLNYHHTDLKKLIDVMAAVESDLKAGRYQSALRRREVVLDGLSNIKTYLQGEFAVRKDESANLPEEIQKDLLSGMQEASPAGWEELNRRYFERLSSEEAGKK